MSLSIYNSVDEEDVAKAIRYGDLRLELILQYVLEDDSTVDMLINEMEPLGGTKEAGERAAKFAEAMIKA